jgi:hypothetical protein
MNSSITSPERLQQAIDKAISGDKVVLFSISKYIAYHYYMCFHIKEGTTDDLANDVIYKAFKKEHPELFAKVEGLIDYEYRKWTMDEDEF